MQDTGRDASMIGYSSAYASPDTPIPIAARAAHDGRLIDRPRLQGSNHWLLDHLPLAVQTLRGVTCADA
jgi:hypothetical protein